MTITGMNNESKRVYGPEIIKEHEHPVFNIGDCITNGEVEHKVIGYSRSPLGLSYALDLRYTDAPFFWLTEQVDKLFRLKDQAHIKLTPSYSIDGNKMIFDGIDTSEKRVAMIKAYESLDKKAKFKVGDIVRLRGIRDGWIVKIEKILEEGYFCNTCFIRFESEDDWVLVDTTNKEG